MPFLQFKENWEEAKTMENRNARWKRISQKSLLGRGLKLACPACRSAANTSVAYVTFLAGVCEHEPGHEYEYEHEHELKLRHGDDVARLLFLLHPPQSPKETQLPNLVPDDSL